MKKALMFISVFLIHSLNAHVTIKTWSFESTGDVFKNSVLSAIGVGGIVYFLNNAAENGFKGRDATYFVGASAGLGGLIGYLIASYCTPESRFNRAVEMFYEKRYTDLLQIIEQADSAEAFYEELDTFLADRQYPRVDAMFLVESTQIMLKNCASLLQAAVTEESGRSYSDPVIIEEGKRLLDLIPHQQLLIARMMPELKNNQTYLLQRSAYMAELAMIEAKNAAFDARMASLNSHWHCHWSCHRHCKGQKSCLS